MQSEHSLCACVSLLMPCVLRAGTRVRWFRMSRALAFRSPLLLFRVIGVTRARPVRNATFAKAFPALLEKGAAPRCKRERDFVHLSSPWSRQGRALRVRPGRRTIFEMSPATRVRNAMRPLSKKWFFYVAVVGMVVRVPSFPQHCLLLSRDSNISRSGAKTED